MYPVFRILAAAFYCLTLLSVSARATDEPVAAEEAIVLSPLQTAVADRIALEPKRDENGAALRDYYGEPENPLLWITDGRANDKARHLIRAFKSVDDDALNPEAYSYSLLETLKNETAPASLADLEITLSRALLDYALHMTAGQIKPSEADSAMKIYPEGPDPADVLAEALITPDMFRFAASFQPATQRYVRLKAKLSEFRAMARAGAWTIIPEGETLKEDMEDERVPLLRERLIQSGHLAPDTHDGSIYDGALVDAVKLFQERHGLAVDGVIGPNTLKEINVTIDTRIRQMELNLERRRWMSDDLGEFFVHVNLADQNLKVVRYPKTIYTARVVVGKPYHATPVFSRDMDHVVINPYWNVPYSIATKEYLPKLKSNAGALTSQNIRVLANGNEVSPYAINWASYSRGNFPFRLRQEPGPKNALGRIKFMFPNEHNVYIHDTPAKSLFNKALRAYSHGCVRVQDPAKLAEVLLGREGWSRDRIDGQIASGNRKIVSLSETIPVHITYLTAWVNKDGSTHFRRDVYGRDKKLDQALKGI